MTQAIFMPAPGPAPAQQPAETGAVVATPEAAITPTGAEHIPEVLTNLPIEYATIRWEVCDPDLKAMVGTPPCLDVPQARLFYDQLNTWLKEGLGSSWAIVLAHMLWRAGSALDHSVCIESIAKMLGYTRSWTANVMAGLCRLGFLQKMPGETGRPRLFKFAKHEHMLRLIRQNRNEWRRKKISGGAAQ